MNKEAILAFAERPIAFYPAFARIGGSVNAGVFLSQLFFWTGKGKKADGWIYKTRDEWTEETTLSRYEQEHARKLLRERGLIEERYAGIPRQLYYRLDMDRLTYALTVTQSSDGDISSWWENPQLDGDKTPDNEAENPPAREPETTPLIHRLPIDYPENTQQQRAAFFALLNRAGVILGSAMQTDQWAEILETTNDLKIIEEALAEAAKQGRVPNAAYVRRVIERAVSQGLRPGQWPQKPKQPAPPEQANAGARQESWDA